MSAGLSGNLDGTPILLGLDLEAAWIQAIPSRGVLLASVLPTASVRWSPSTEKVLSTATVTVAVADAANNGALSSV